MDASCAAQMHFSPIIVLYNLCTFLLPAKAIAFLLPAVVSTECSLEA